MFVRWGSTVSTHFTVANGVKQGEVISPILFIIYMYMDKPSITLNSSGIGGYLGNVFLNHLCYADDLRLISLSSTEMQQLIPTIEHMSELCYGPAIIVQWIKVIFLML